MLILAFLILDLLTVVALFYYFGLVTTILVVVALSVLGIVLCIWSTTRLQTIRNKYAQEFIGGLPDELRLINITEARGTVMLCLLFLFPGILSDFLAFFMLMPKFSKNYYERLLYALRAEAERQGKSVEQMIAMKCGKCED